MLVLDGDTYVEYGVHTRGDQAASPLLDGFAADVPAVFDAPESGAYRRVACIIVRSSGNEVAGARAATR